MLAFPINSSATLDFSLVKFSFFWCASSTAVKGANESYMSVWALASCWSSTFVDDEASYFIMVSICEVLVAGIFGKRYWHPTGICSLLGTLQAHF